MRLTLDTINHQAQAFADRLRFGSVRLYGGSPPASPGSATFAEALATLPFGDAAFSARGTELVADRPVMGVATRSGDAMWAELLTAGGVVIADLMVRASDAVDAELADIRLDRTDVQRGGEVTLTNLVFRLPLQG